MGDGAKRTLTAELIVESILTVTSAATYFFKYYWRKMRVNHRSQIIAHRSVGRGSVRDGRVTPASQTEKTSITNFLDLSQSLQTQHAVNEPSPAQTELRPSEVFWNFQ